MGRCNVGRNDGFSWSCGKHESVGREYWSSNLSQATPFLQVVFHIDRFLEILYNFHYPELEGSVHRLRKVLYLVQHLSQQYQRFYVPERERFMWMRVLLVSKAEPQPPNICRTNITIVGV